MYRNALFLPLLALLCLLPVQHAAAQQAITVTVPEQTIASSIKAVLPFTLDTSKLPLKGEFVIVDISNLQITDGAVSCKLKLAGENMGLSADIGGRKINLDVGSVELNVDANTLLSFDAAKQTLYLKPVIKNAQSSGSDRAAQVAPTLVALLDGQQFPIALQSLQPALIRTATKQITINTRIVNVQPKKGVLQLQVLPAVSSS